MAPAAFNSPVLSIEVEGHLGFLRLARPEAGNAMGPAFWSDLPLAVEALCEDDAVRCIVLTADGGGGTSSQASRNISLNRNIKSMQASISAQAECRVPVIAAVHGWCIGGGVDLIAACDIRVASDDAKFSVREAKVAIVADIGSLQRLPKIIGAGHVAELALTGKDIDADRAATIGLVNHVAAGGAEGVAALARQIADEIAVNSPLAVEGTKAVLAANDGRTVAEGLEYVADFNTLYINSNDLIEAMTSFMEKRPGNYTGT